MLNGNINKLKQVKNFCRNEPSRDYSGQGSRK